MIDKRMESLESMKKIVLREAYFIEEEKRLINEKRQQMANELRNQH